MDGLTATDSSPGLMPSNGFPKKAVFLPIAAILLLSLQFQTLPIRIQIQSLPLTTVFALLFLPFVIGRIPRSPLLSILAIFFGFVFLHSLIFLLVDLFSNQPDTRFIAWARQSFALFAGIVTFLVFRTAFLHVSLQQIFKFIAWGTVPALLLSVLNILWGAFGQGWAGGIVAGIRDFMSPEGYTSPLRATGFATEPAALATSLVVTLLPVLFVYFGQKRNRFWTIVLLILATASFMWTFSTVGLLLMLGVLGAGLFFGPKKKIILLVFTLFVGATLMVTVLFPSNQILRHAGTIAAGRANVSFTDRFYSAVGPFMEGLSSYSIVGYGLGGISTHFREVLPTQFQAEILATKWKEFPNLAILFGRVFAETGAIGFVLFLTAIYMTFRQLKFIMRNDTVAGSALTYSSIRLGLIASCLALLISVGPYHTPYVWIWMAVIDAKYVLSTQKAYQW